MRVCLPVCCVCVRVHMFSFVWKISTHFPCSGGLRPRSCEVHPAVIGWASIVMECHGVPQQLDGLQWKIMENPMKSCENPMEILWKLDDLGLPPWKPPWFWWLRLTLSTTATPNGIAMGMRHVDVSSNGCLMAKYVLWQNHAIYNMFHDFHGYYGNMFTSKNILVDINYKSWQYVYDC